MRDQLAGDFTNRAKSHVHDKRLVRTGKGRPVERALQERVDPISLDTINRRPVIFASYNGARKQANLLPLLMLLLEAHGVPVHIHGARNDASRDTTAGNLAALDIPASETVAPAGRRIGATRVTYLPTEVAAPALPRLLATRDRLGLRSSAHTMAKLADPFGGQSLRVIGVAHPHFLARLHEFLLAVGAAAVC
jgi:anthranilate phosphoribosyltransferase